MLGMAHRGRLNVLAHILEKPYAQILAEFKDPVAGPIVADRPRLDGRREVPRRRTNGGAARPDVHHDAAEPEPSRSGGSGRRRHGARGGHVRRSARAPRISTARVTLPILIHGDAAFPGQGIVAETLNLSRLAGYSTGGTIHIIANNQLGFTATPAESYSTSYASGLARGFKIPIVHVNADDPVACLEAARLGVGIPRALRARLPDRSGRLPALRPQRGRRAGVHAAADVQDGRVASDRARELGADARREGHHSAGAARRAGEEALRGARIDATRRSSPSRTSSPPLPTPAAGRHARRRSRPAFRSIGCARSTTRCSPRPEGFTFHRKLERGRERRRAAFAEPGRAVDRLGDGRGAGVRHDPGRRHSDPDDRRGRRARHLQPSPRGVPRREHRQAVHPAAGVPAGARGVRDPQQPAHRERDHRLRVRLQRAGAAAAGDLGSAVRRLHQRRAGDARPVRHVRAARSGD